MLGALFAVLSAASFALNNATVRRGVVSGTPLQAMAVSVPLGVVCFLPLAFLSGQLMRLPQFSIHAIGWMAGFGLLHFIIGRYCNFRANSVAGVNLTAPVVQLQVVVTMVLAVIILHEPCTGLQMIGGILILAGSLITQRAPARTVAGGATRQPSAFAPRYLAGYLFASFAAAAYGTTAVASLALLSPRIRSNVAALHRDNARWFALSGVFVAAAQGFFFAAVAVAPVMLVMPLLQLSLAFRMLFSTWLNPAHEIIGPLVLVGVLVSVSGALMVSIDTGLIVHTLALPEPVARLLLWRV